MASTVLPKMGGGKANAPIGVMYTTQTLALGDGQYTGNWDFSGGIINSDYISCEGTTYTIIKSGNYTLTKNVGHGGELYNPVWSGGIADGYVEAGTTFYVHLKMSKGTAYDGGLAAIMLTYNGEGG